jgi:sulfite reductase beta subunit-like hemoprotein
MTGKPESKVEVAKRHGRHLRGTIAETLASERTHFGHDDIQLLKFHGAYQQDDGDVRRERGRARERGAMVRWRFRPAPSPSSTRSSGSPTSTPAAPCG